MGMYRLGEIIRMTRKSLSITQEKLSEGICSLETLSRMETGKQTPSKDTYELLMVRMGRIGERGYSMLSITDLRVLDKIQLFNDCIQLYDYKQAEIELKELEGILGNSRLDKQFLLRAKSIINYYLYGISVDEFLDGLQKAIRLTIPKYGEISLCNWPLSNNEIVLILNISMAYADKLDYKKAIETLEEMNNALDKSFIEEHQKAIVQSANLYHLARWYGLIMNHEKAIEIAMEGIAKCKKNRLGNVLANHLYCIAWNKEQLMDKGILSLDHKEECLMYLRKAYFVASAMQQTFIIQFLEEQMEERYDLTDLFVF